MCRYDDDYEWTVDSQDDAATSDMPLLCEDCGRVIDAGEIHTAFTAYGYEGDDGYVFAAQDPMHAGHSVGRLLPDHRWVRDHLPHVVIDEDDAWLWEGLGFVVDEIEAPRETQIHISCAQCIIAAGWLTKICQQHTVMVTRIDLLEHWHEYDRQTLGPDFERLKMLAGQRWQLVPGTKAGLAHPDYVGKLTTRAIAHAVAAGLDGSHA